MAASNPRSPTTWSTFAGDPATPITRQPPRLASWPTTEPTAPAAAVTTTVSPATGRATSNSPW